MAMTMNSYDVKYIQAWNNVHNLADNTFKCLLDVKTFFDLDSNEVCF